LVAEDLAAAGDMADTADIAAEAAEGEGEQA
jgi:hypothetical protein